MTLAALTQIRDEIRTTRTELSARLDQTNELLDQTNELLDQTNERLDQTNERLSHLEVAMLDLAEQQRFTVRWLTAGTERDRRLERDVSELKLRLAAVERRFPER
jgi:uncharacterized protein YoxC